MNDRFKFRYFNKYANKMVKPKNWQNVDGIYECIKQQVCFDEDIAPLPYDHIGNGLVFMQCTGLKDKNGKLIYEGDILQENWHKYILEWGNGAYVIKDIKRGTSYMFTSGICIHKSEVIGNIYENPELIERI